jgi:hypothetical protein
MPSPEIEIIKSDNCATGWELHNAMCSFQDIADAEGEPAVLYVVLPDERQLERIELRKRRLTDGSFVYDAVLHFESAEAEGNHAP